jgi:hypothetical protein
MKPENTIAPKQPYIISDHFPRGKRNCIAMYSFKGKQKRKTKETQEIKVINAKALNAYLNQPKNNKD